MTVRLRRFSRTPKGFLIGVLLALVAVSAVSTGLSLAAPGVLAAVLTAALIDLVILRYRKQRWVFPDGAVLTGLIIAMVLSPHEPWRITALTAAIAVLSKYLLRSGPTNIFNPAALALVITFHLYDTGQSWWGALPEVAPAAILMLLTAGILTTRKVKKAPVVLAFLGGYYLLVTAAAFLGDPANVAELYRTPDLQAAIYFAVFMLNDPPTSPPRSRDQVVFGLIVAAISFGIFEWMGWADYLLIGLLAGNLWESIRRARTRSLRTRQA